MPTYEYVCLKCDQHFEKFQSMNDKPLTTCPEESCGQRKWGKGRVKRTISAGAGLIFKGSGFYITDYRSEGYKEAAKKDSVSSTSSSSETKKSGGESKPASGSSESKPKTSSKKE